MDGCIKAVDSIQIVEDSDVQLSIDVALLEGIAVEEVSDIHVSPNVAILEGVSIEEVVRIRKDILIPLQFEPYLKINVQMALSQDDMFYLESFRKNERSERRQLIGRYYFAMKYNTQKIAKMLGIAQPNIAAEVNKIKRALIGRIQRDITTHNKVLGHMVELMMQVEERVKVCWKKYYDLDDDCEVIRKVMREYSNQAPAEAIVLTRIEQLAGKLLSVHGHQQTYLNLLRQETKQMLEIWERFGLTGEEAVKVVMSGNIDVNVRVEEIRINIVRMIGIIKQEVADQDIKGVVFARMSKELKFSGFDSTN